MTGRERWRSVRVGSSYRERKGEVGGVWDRGTGRKFSKGGKYEYIKIV